MNFTDKLKRIVEKNNSWLCINLDADLNKIGDKTQFEFNKEIIDQTADLVCGYKINSAFYEADGANGIEQLKKTFDYLKQNHPDIIRILDAKRGDIGNTNNGYAQFAFEYLNADALTIAPYMGGESLKPFLDYSDKYFFVLARTSNPGSGEFQELEVNGAALFETIAKNAINWGENVSIVVGATYPEELKKLKEISGERPLLIPGIGAQGGSVRETIENAGQDNLICVGRSIIFADNPRQKTQELQKEMNNG